MKLHFYIKNTGGIDKEFIIWDERKPKRKTEDGFKLVSTVEADVNEVTWPMLYSTRYVRQSS